MTDTPTAPPRLFREGTLAARFALAFLAASGLFYVNIMAALVDGLIGGLHFSTKDAGFVGSANVYGAAAGALLAVFLVKRVYWKVGVATALAGMLLIDLGSMALHTPDLLIGVRFMHGVFGGSVTGLVFAVIARTGTADRTFGALLLVQYGLAGLGLLLLPRLTEHFGAGVLFLALAGCSVVALAILPTLSAYRVVASAAPVQAAKAPVRWTLLALAFGAIFLFQSSNMAVAAYVIGLGRNAGLGTEYISNALGIANWIGAVGSLAVMTMGVRYGRATPFVAGMALTIAGTLAFLFSANPLIYFAANAITSITWSYVIPYLLGMAAAFDKSGQMGALGGFFSKIGLATGPLVGAFMLGQENYAALVAWAAVVMVMCVVAGVAPALVLDREKGEPVPIPAAAEAHPTA